jgi:ABC-type multidrug transport system fused ATPase/permease subunit
VTAPPPAQQSVMRRGVRLLARLAGLNPLPFTLALLGATVFALMAVGSTIVLGRVTDDALIPAFDDGVSSGTVWAAAVAILVIAFLRGSGVVARRWFGQMTVRRGQVAVREQLTHHYMSVPLEFFRRHPTGELLAHADTDVEVSFEAVNPLPFSLGVFVLVGASVVSLFLVDWVLAVVGLVLFPALAVLNRYYTRRVEGPAGRVQHHIGQVSSIAHESFDGALVVKSLGREAAEVERLAGASEDLRAARVDVGRLRALFEPTLEALPNLGIIAVLLVGGFRVDSGAVTTGDLVQVMTLFTLLVFPARVFGYLLEELPRSVVALERLDRMLADDGGSRAIRGQAEAPDGPLGVEVSGVGFAYLEGDDVLSDCSFSIAPGETVALVGATGSGKSTLCEMLVGLVPPDRGSVSIGGRDLATLAPDAVRGAAALVFQESFLFADSIGENITLGVVASERARERAARIAHVHDFVRRLPRAYDTRVGERGITLSGGQRQRVALARALVRNPRLLILDDATSAVDPTVEARILDGLGRELEMTTLIVAHRRSTIELADRVLFLSGGRITASGTHQELLADPDYEAMVRAYEETAEAEAQPTEREAQLGASGVRT